MTDLRNIQYRRKELADYTNKDTHLDWPDTYGDPGWFIHDRFGLFIHFGLFSAAARHEWVMTLEQINKEDYRKYFDYFNPDLLDMRQWAKKAREAGFTYAVLTTKHHEGFALWDSALTDYKVTNTPCGRDLVREFVDAFRAEGLQIGFYFSLIDWYHPAFTVDGYHPMRNDDAYIRSHPGDMAAYTEFMHGQVKELLTGYGKIDYLWFDFSYENRDWGKSVGKGSADWRSKELEQLILSLQPDIIINDRLGLGRGVKTPEQYQRHARMEDGQKKLVWEACQTLNGSWGYDRDNLDWKPADMLIRLLTDTVSKGGNLLLNIGPDGRGQIDAPTTARLDSIGEWMRLHKDAIIGCSESQFIAPTDTRFTQNGKHLYLHLFAWPYRTLVLEGLGGKVAYARFLHDHSEIRFIEAEGLSGRRKSHTDLNQEVTEIHIKDKFADDTLMLTLPVQRPDVLTPVIELILK